MTFVIVALSSFLVPLVHAGSKTPPAPNVYINATNNTCANGGSIPVSGYFLIAEFGAVIILISFLSIYWVVNEAWLKRKRLGMEMIDLENTPEASPVVSPAPRAKKKNRTRWLKRNNQDASQSRPVVLLTQPRVKNRHRQLEQVAEQVADHVDPPPQYGVGNCPDSYEGPISPLQ